MERSRSCSPIGTQIRQRSGTPRRPPHLAASTQNSSLLGRPSPPRTLSRFVRSLLWSPPRLPDARSQRPGHPVSGRGEPDSSPSSDRRMGTASGRERPSLSPRLPAERDRPPRQCPRPPSSPTLPPRTARAAGSLLNRSSHNPPASYEAFSQVCPGMSPVMPTMLPERRIGHQLGVASHVQT